jgi:hypothetical protein
MQFYKQKWYLIFTQTIMMYQHSCYECKCCSCTYYSCTEVVSVTSLMLFCISYLITVGHVVAQLVEALRYKPEGRGIDSQWCHRNFSLT